MKSIILTTLNAKYIHTSIGLKYLYANLKELKTSARIQEYIITDNTNEIAENLLASKPLIIGLGVYIWNALETHKLINIIKKIAPKTIVILGGPEVSHFPMRVDFSLADHIIQGEGELSFYSLCKSLLNNKTSKKRVIKSKLVDLKKIELPYNLYTDEDVKNRVVYIETSRGCPFKCKFCLSSIDKTVLEFDIDLILQHLSILWDRGVRKFKFVDRSFNINIDNSCRILDHFLQMKPPYLIHFEFIPDLFPNILKEKIKQFPPATIQLEIGIQTLKSKTLKTINRSTDIKKVKQNLQFLEKNTNAYLHVDLIVGLPGEEIKDLSSNLNLLTSLTNSEIQIGILKKLSGTMISRHDDTHGMIYSDTPPYEILQNYLIPFKSMQKMKRFARFWDLFYNSGNFNRTVRLLWDDGDTFKQFYSFSQWNYSESQSTWKISLNRLAELLFKYLIVVQKKDTVYVADILIKDLLIFRGRKFPAFLKKYASYIPYINNYNALKINHRQIKNKSNISIA